jgi:hypothetical protein
VVGAGGLELHEAEEPVVVVGELEEGDVGGALEETFEDGEESDHDDAGEQSRPVARPADICFRMVTNSRRSMKPMRSAKVATVRPAKREARTTLPRLRVWRLQKMATMEARKVRTRTSSRLP